MVGFPASHVGFQGGNPPSTRQKGYVVIIQIQDELGEV